MQLVSLVAATLASVLSALVQSQQSVTYDTIYDDPATSIARPDGVNDLILDPYSTLGSLPNFPYVGVCCRD